MSYQYPKTTSQVDICRNIFINALEGLRAEEGKTRQTNHLQDHLWQDIWWFLCQMIQKFVTNVLTLCLLAFWIWMLGFFAIVSSVLSPPVIPRPRPTGSPSSNNPKYSFFNSVLSARNYQPKRVSPSSCDKPIYLPLNGVLSVKAHQLIHTSILSYQPKLIRKYIHWSTASQTNDTKS